ncbi:MAG: hypothetical protein K2Z81_16800, partial [Cyanobacteria bacterium]|nr:hypothetical protein [Cyanobacteriota bacterium]
MSSNGTATAVSDTAKSPNLERPEPTRIASTAEKQHETRHELEFSETLKHGRQSTFMRAMALFAAINMLLAFT